MTRRSGRRGNQVVEFALMTPILLVLAAGVVDLGQYMYVDDGLVNAVAQGGRAGAFVDPDDGDPAATATAVVEESWTASALPGTLTVTSTISGTSPNQKLVVHGEVTFDAFFGLLQLPDTVDYTSTVYLMFQ